MLRSNIFGRDYPMRFVILEHDHPFLHWDLMLEAGKVLRTWRLLTEPVMGMAIAAEPLGDHRKMYLDYEGPVSGGRGQVRRWDAGMLEWKVDSAERTVVQLKGTRVKGEVIVEKGTFLWRKS
jgi:DNA polymerase ligase (LigD)-like protein